jgi:hypothetical protein
MKTDSKLKSISESFTNIVVGFPINYGANLVIIPFFLDGWNTVEESLLTAFYIGFWFTVVSVIRTYALRRLFNRFGKNENFYTLLIRAGKGIKKKIV